MYLSFVIVSFANKSIINTRNYNKIYGSQANNLTDILIDMSLIDTNSL